jgi:hypothetical protein
MNNLILRLLIVLLPGMVKAQTDTLFSFFNPNEATLIASPNGGYLSGTNGYGDMEKLQLFFPQAPMSVLGVFCWTGIASNVSEDPNSAVIFRIRSFDSTGFVSSFPLGPAATLDSVIVPLNNLQTDGSFPNNLQFIPFTQPVLVTGPYLAGFSLEQIAQTNNVFTDTFAVYTTAADSARQIGYSWEKWEGEYKQIAETWGINIDFAIFPVIDTTLNSKRTVSSEPLNLYPNPAEDFFILSKLDPSEKYRLEIRDISGRFMLNKDFSSKEEKVKIDISHLPNGSYSVILERKSSINVGLLIIR